MLTKTMIALLVAALAFGSAFAKGRDKSDRSDDKGRSGRVEAKAEGHAEDTSDDKGGEKKSCCAPKKEGSAGDLAAAERLSKADAPILMPEIADVEVVDHRGRKLNFYRDLVQDKVVMIQFIFTTCTTVCKPLTATFAQVQKQLGPGADVHLISISVDPTIDVPERMAAYAQKFGAGDRWHMVTGEKANIDRLLKSLGAYTGDKNNHTSFVLAGNARTGRFLRTWGMASADTLVEKIKDVASARDRAYFTDLALVDQDGRSVRFYTDVMEGKLVVANFMFTRCKSVCPVQGATMKRLQERLKDVVGREVALVSITVDPEHDTPEKMREFAQRMGAGPGWTFLSGKPENVNWVAYKLGGYTENKDEHLAAFLIGDTVINEWTKAVPNSKPEQLEEAVRTMLKERRAKLEAELAEKAATLSAAR